jgi:hypothetical protein
MILSREKGTMRQRFSSGERVGKSTSSKLGLIEDPAIKWLIKNLSTASRM